MHLIYFGADSAILEEKEITKRADKMGWENPESKILSSADILTCNLSGTSKPCVIGLWITAEAELLATVLLAIVKRLANCLPGGDIRGTEFRNRNGQDAAGPCGNHAHRAADDQCG
jgi:hypothetical protein